MNNILVIGSTNVDSIARVSRLPVAGETVGDAELNFMLGGKGANQAIAARRTGSSVTFITSLGDDSHGDDAYKFLKDEGINLSHAKRCKDMTTGQAYIFVDDNGENFIAVSPGSNALLTKADIDQAEDQFSKCDVVLMQMEIPYETVLYACKKAKKYNLKVILNPAPAKKIGKEILEHVDYLIINLTEAEIITDIHSPEKNLDQACNKLREMGAETTIITLGNNGCFFSSNNLKKKFGAFKVVSVDSTAAGDTFCGALASYIDNNNNIEAVINFASAAAALTVTKNGATDSIPHKSEILEFITDNQNNKHS